MRVTGRARPVIVFGKAPIPGRVKTRLIPRLGPTGAARLHERLTRHALRVASAAALGPVELCADGWNDALEALAKEFGARRAEQGEGDIGVRMARALERTPGALLIGTDSIVLDPAYLRIAAAQLDRHDAVFGPTEDGGYLLVGIARAIPSVFDAIDWSTARVMAQTRAQLALAGASWAELAVVWDIDRPADLDRVIAAGWDVD